MLRSSRRAAAIIVLALVTGVSAAGGAGSGGDSARGLLFRLTERGTINFASGVGGGQMDNRTCSVAGNPAADFDISCDDTWSPENESPIVANPENPNHLVAGSNDYQIGTAGANLTARIPTGYFVSFDGGATWRDGQIPMGNGSSGGNGDPVPAFNAKFDTVHMAQLSAGCGSFCGHISVSVATSLDGGLTWKQPVTVAQGVASLTPSRAARFNDKEWMTVDNNPSSPFFGRIYVTWTGFQLAGGGYLRSPVMLSYSDNAGKSWTVPKEISGSHPGLCTFQETGPAGECDEDQFSVPVVLPNGNLVVHFVNSQNSSTWEAGELFEGQILVVRSTNGGASFSAPTLVAALEDGTLDYPFNVDGRATQTGHQFRTQTVQGMAADPLTGALYVFFADNRNGTRDVPAATPVTQTDVFVVKSTNGGVSWGSPIQVSGGPADQWFPWADARGDVVKVMYMDGVYDWPNRDRYGITLATSNDGGATWSYQRIDSGLSDPEHSVWFRANVAGCAQCATFIGDYNGLAIDTLGRTHLVWTDMRRVFTFAPLARTGAAQDIFYARR